MYPISAPEVKAYVRRIVTDMSADQVRDCIERDVTRRLINDIANLESVQWWHRNLSRGKGFRINGFLNHYPDFIVKTKAGKIIALETKGDDRDNSDSELKLKLGKLWESKAGRDYRYMMVFENKPIDGAERLADALKKMGQL